VSTAEAGLASAAGEAAGTTGPLGAAHAAGATSEPGATLEACAAGEAGAASEAGATSEACAAGSSGTPGPSAPPKRPAAHKQIVALAPRRFKIEITVDQETHDKLRFLQDLLRHRLPSTDPTAIVSRAIALLLDETLKKKAALTEAPRPAHAAHAGSPTRAPHAAHRTRAIPAAIRRAVWRRDAGRCAFVDEQGRRCRETSWIEYHHEVPYGKGGRHETANIALRCRAHNRYQADLDFGTEFMLSKRRGVGPHAARHVIDGR
jgi:hypothetical protein